MNQFHYPCQHVYESLMEAATDDPRRHTAIQVIQQGRKQRSRINNPAAAVSPKLKRVDGAFTLARDGRLEFDGRLGLVIDPLPNSRQRRHCIE